MIYIGNQTSCWAQTPREPFDYALARGFDAFEWFPDKKPGAGWDESDLAAEVRQQIRAAASAHGIRLSVHARWQASPLAADSYPLLWQDLELASDLGAVLLNVHLDHRQGLKAFVEALTPLLRKTADAGMQMSVENTPDHSPEQVNEFFALLRDANSVETGHVGMCLDLGHANLCAATRNDYLGFYDRLDPRIPIIHLHLHENWGDADTHLPLFTGPAGRNDAGIRGLIRRLRRREFSGAIILEQWPHPPSLLDTSRARLLHLWHPGPDKPVKHSVPKPAVPETGPSPAPGTAPGDFMAELVAGDKRGRSWREKLDFVHTILAGETPTLTADQLVDIAIYLRFLGAGEIPCAEDGRHFRPAHHARIAAQIRERLARLTTPDNIVVVRKIYPWLPSAAAAFRRPEPLTRIRDIAHRNDIGPDLKREIKTTLQNKLHRCAGPEDLATSAALLRRITAHAGEYPAAFVEQFRIFHRELKEFFNARSLNERLEALLPSLDEESARLIRLFLQLKVESALPQQAAALRTLTRLRANLLAAAQQATGRQGPEFLMADVALEDFAFVLLSEMINAFEAGKSEPVRELEAEALPLALQNVALSGVDPSECGALEAEFRAWGRLTPSSDRDEVLRLKATTLRCRRLAEDFCARVVALFAGRAEKLGRALGVAEPAIRVFSESDIRGHNVFQVAKLVARLLRQVRERLGEGGWDVLVSGRAVGQAKIVNSLDELEPGTNGPRLVILKNAAGDEEIPANIAGIILARELPHLSHLGVRARQAGVVLVSCEEPPEIERLEALEGNLVALEAQPGSVTCERVPQTDAHGQSAVDDVRRSSPQVPAVRLVPNGSWIPLTDVTPETSGGKAAGMRRLMELARQDGAGFRTPATMVVPFGVMEAGLSATPAIEKEYRDLVGRLHAMEAASFTAATQRLRELIGQVRVPESIVAEAVQRFSADRPLMVRSSANCEDLEGFASAGLYDSVGNVTPGKLAGAIRTVWASLWTSRAALSRQQADIPHEQAHMAVLVQELLVPDYSFVLHTANPISRKPNEVYAEVVVGLGEALASAAARGIPYRFACDKDSDRVTTLAFCNFSQALLPDPNGGLRRETVDYSRIALSLGAAARSKLGRCFAAIGRFLEASLHGPQDVEGAVVQGEINLVQARPQPGWHSSDKG